jgi:thiol-disulfide isomerase/thioredoxin
MARAYNSRGGMDLKRIPITLASLGVLVLAAALGFSFRGENVAKLIEQFKKDRETLLASNNVKAEDYNKLINDFLAKIEFDQAGMDDLIALNGLGVLRSKEVHAKAVARLAAFEGQNGLAGAQRAALRLALEGGYTPAGQASEDKQNELLGALLKDPAFGELVKSKDAGLVFSAIGNMGRKAIWEKNAEAIVHVALQLDANASPEAITSLAGGWRVIDAATKDKPELREKARKHMLGVFNKAAKTRGEDLGKSKSYVERQVKFLDGAFAKGTLLNHSAPGLSIKWSSDPKVKSLADLKGKVVILDFWATWCGPCVASFPNVKELADHYKDKPVVIIGVTSIQGAHYDDSGKIDCKDDPKKEIELMPEYMKKKGMNWTVVFAEEDVFNPEYGVMGIPHVAIIDTKGNVRHNGLHPASPKAEKLKMIDELLKEAGN